jgi:hypothetical protein
MQYLLSLYSEEGRMEDATPEQMAEVLGAWSAFTDETKAKGAFVAGEALQPSATATTIGIKVGDSPSVTDGPFAESKEQLGGFYLLECGDLDEALGWAKKIPYDQGKVEVRPIMVFD